MAKEKPLIHTVATFVKFHLGKEAFAAHTGQDFPAWGAFVYLVQCWCRGGGGDAIRAMRTTLLCAQPTFDVLQTFVQAIPAVGDWPHVKELWPSVVGDLELVDGKRAVEVYAMERCLAYTPEGKSLGTKHIYKFSAV